MLRKFLAGCLLVVVFSLGGGFSGATVAVAEDWPQWRGIERDGTSAETDLLEKWPDEGPKLVWLYKKAGPGYSGPAVVGNRVYLLIARKKKTQLVAINAETGEDVWTAEMGEIYRNNWGDGPRGTPTVDGDRIYALGGEGELVCARTQDGDVMWRVSMVDDLGGKIPVWGYSESVLVDGDHVICTPGGSQGAIVALDKLTGKIVWQTEDLTATAHYSSLLHAKFSPHPHYVQLLEDSVVGIAPQDGQVLWSQPWEGRVAVIPTPVVVENSVYVTSGYGAGCKLLKLAQNGNEIAATEAYNSKVMKNHHGGVVLVDGHIYGYSDNAGWMCHELESGKEIWTEREKLAKGSITYADGHLYCLSEETGELALIAASPDGWKESSRFKIDPQTTHRKPYGRIWTHPVISNGRLYLRDQELFFCFDISSL